MIDNFELVEHIKQQAESLVNENSNLRDQLEKNSVENNRLNKEIFELKQRIKTLNERIEVLTLANGLIGGASNEDRKASQTKIRKILREINDCIALINNN